MRRPGGSLVRRGLIGWECGVWSRVGRLPVQAGGLGASWLCEPDGEAPSALVRTAQLGMG